MKYAVLKTGGKQYRVTEGEVIKVEKLAGEKDGPVNFSEVLLYVNDDKLKLGQPRLTKSRVEGVIVKEIKEEKVRGFVYKRKGHRRSFGHRQKLTKVRIDKIMA